MIFSRMCLSNANEEPLPGGGGMTVYSGVIIHHQINNGEPFTLRCLYTPRMGTRNTIFIRAAEGVDYSLIGSQGLLDEMSEAKESAASQGITF